MDGKWVHNPPSAEVKEAFESLQQSLTEDLILHRPDFDKPFHLWIDAAQKIGGCGAILAQKKRYAEVLQEHSIRQ